MDSALDLQKCLTEWIKQEMSDFKSRNSYGDLVDFNVYNQALPIPKTENEKPYPYIINMVVSQGIERENTQISCVLLIGVYNDAAENQGHQEVLNVMQKIYQGLFSEGWIGEKYHAEYPIEMELQVKEERYPYFYGMMEIHFSGLNSVGLASKEVLEWL